MKHLLHNFHSGQSDKKSKFRHGSQMQELRIEGGAGEGVDNILSAAFHLLHSSKIYRSFDFGKLYFSVRKGQI